VVVDALPFEHWSDTRGRTSHLDQYGEACDPGPSPAPDAVYLLEAEQDEIYWVTVTPSANFDTLLSVLSVCAEDMPCEEWADSGPEGETELITLRADVPGMTFIVVDGVGGSSGDFVLSVTTVPDEDPDTGTVTAGGCNCAVRVPALGSTSLPLLLLVSVLRRRRSAPGVSNRTEAHA
jgi:hypothetical protein